MQKKRTTTQKTKKRKSARRTMKTEKEDPDDQQLSPQPEEKSAFMEAVDLELEALRGICYAFEGMDQETRIRTFNYLKARYGQ